MSFTDFKEATANNPGSAVRFGGNDLKEVMQILNGKVVASRRPRILNTWLWLDHFDMKPPGVAPSPPTETNSSRFYVDPSDNKVKIKKTSGTIIDLENVGIPDTALATITDKAKLNANIVYKDQNNDLGDFYLDFGDIAVPANPAAGKRRIFFDQATGKLSVRTSAGTTIDLEATGGGGSGDVMLNAANTYGDFDSLFRSGRLKVRNPANTFSYALTGSAITADRAITFPLLTAGDTLVTAAFAQTLTNKTIDAASNTISNIGDTQHSIHTTSKISTLSKSLLNSALLYNDQNNSFGAFYHDISQISVPANPAAGTRRIFLDSASGKLSTKTSAGGVVALENTVWPDTAAGGTIWGLWTGGARDGTALFANCRPFGTISTRSDTTTTGQNTTDFATGTTIGNQAGFSGWDVPVAGLHTQRDQNFRFKTRFQTNDITSQRFAIGMAAVAALPNTTDAFLATAVAGFLFRYSSTTDTTIKLLRNDAAGAPVQVDTGVTLANNTPVTLEIIADEPNTRMGWAINEGAVTYYTTDIPIATTSLNYHFRNETKVASIRRLDMYYAYMTQKSVP